MSTFKAGDKGVTRNGEECLVLYIAPKKHGLERPMMVLHGGPKTTGVVQHYRDGSLNPHCDVAGDLLTFEEYEKTVRKPVKPDTRPSIGDVIGYFSTDDYDEPIPVDDKVAFVTSDGRRVHLLSIYEDEENGGWIVDIGDGDE